MTEYYIILPGDKWKDVNENNLLGTCSLYETFWPGTGYEVLNKIAETEPELLEHITIINSKKTKLTVIQFLDMLETYKIKQY
jgi:hypothetical protein